MASINDNNRWKEKIMKDKKKFAKKTIIPMPLSLLHSWTIWLLDAFVKSCTWALAQSKATLDSPDISLNLQFLIQPLVMCCQAAQAVTRIVHPTSYLEPVQRAGWRGSWLQTANHTHLVFECQREEVKQRFKGISMKQHKFDCESKGNYSTIP